MDKAARPPFERSGRRVPLALLVRSADDDCDLMRVQQKRLGSALIRIMVPSPLLAVAPWFWLCVCVWVDWV